MKKFIAALIVVAMVVSAFSMAFAANIACWKFSEPDSSRNKAQVAGLKAGDKITFYVKPVADSNVDKADMYVRCGSDKATYDESGKEVYSGNHIASFGTECSDGWYLIKCTVPVDGDYDFFVDNVNMEGVNLGQSLIAGITVNGAAVDPANVLLATQDADIAEPTVVAGETPADGGDGDGEDETPAKETKPAKTGVVSAAVIAAAAVLGGAVVLKKREF